MSLRHFALPTITSRAPNSLSAASKLAVAKPIVGRLPLIVAPTYIEKWLVEKAKPANFANPDEKICPNRPRLSAPAKCLTSGAARGAHAKNSQIA
jgi:hypothetical protein